MTGPAVITNVWADLLFSGSGRKVTSQISRQRRRLSRKHLSKPDIAAGVSRGDRVPSANALRAREQLAAIRQIASPPD